MNKIFAFIFPFGEGKAFRILLSHADADRASEWAATQLSVGEICHFAEVDSAADTYEDTPHPRHTVEMHEDGWLVTNP